MRIIPQCLFPVLWDIYFTISYGGVEMIQPPAKVIMEYDILTEYSAGEMVKSINLASREGWQRSGHLLTYLEPWGNGENHIVFYQVISRSIK